jgi:two-component SAPR family response regulator
MNTNEQEKVKLYLENALELSKKHNITAIYNQYPSLMKKILLEAKKLNIYKDYVDYLLNLYTLSDVNTAKIKIYTFGRFKVMLDGKEISDWKGGKALYLLKTIVALSGENIPVEKIVNIIWEDFDFIKAKQNFEFTLRKLRKILNDTSKNIVILKNGRISLNRDFIWMDLWEFNDIYSEIEFLINRNKVEDIKNNEKLYKLKSLYKGKFLELEEDIWIEPIRNRIDANYKKLSQYF